MAMTATDSLPQKPQRASASPPDRVFSMSEVTLHGFHGEVAGAPGLRWLGPQHEGHLTLQGVPAGARSLRLSIVDFAHDAIFEEGRVSVEGCMVPVQRSRTGPRSGEWEVVVPRAPITPQTIDVVVRVPALYTVALDAKGETRKKAALALGEIGVWCNSSL